MCFIKHVGSIGFWRFLCFYSNCLMLLAISMASKTMALQKFVRRSVSLWHKSHKFSFRINGKYFILVWTVLRPNVWYILYWENYSTLLYTKIYFVSYSRLHCIILFSFQEKLKEYFSQFGPVSDVLVMKDPISQVSS